MKKHILILTLILSACKPHIPTEAPILAFGDSLTYGYGATHSWTYYLQQKTGLVVINEGKNGRTAKEGVAEIDSYLIKHSPKTVLIILGGNDFLRQTPSEDVAKSLSDIIDKVELRGIRPILVAEPRVSLGFTLSDHDIYKSVAKTKNVELIEGLWSEILSKPDLKSDPIHANDKGYEFFADKISKILID